MTLWKCSHVRSRDKPKAKFFSCTAPVTTKLGRMVTYNEETSPWGHVTNWKQNISSSAKLGRVVTCDGRNSPIMTDEPLITWTRKVAWQIENLISSPMQGQWPINCWEKPTYWFIWSSEKVVMCGYVSN